DIVDAHIARIEAVNPAINAVVTPLFDQARQQAAALTGQLQTFAPADLPPLFGVPVTVKDALAMRGVRHTAGYWPFRDHIGEEDAAAVTRFKQAGAIILGRTNCPDLSMSVETENPIFGLTRNPRRLDRTVGGSSGGEAAIIAAGGSPLGLGSDVAGSVRLPAAMCGIVALKPSAGRIPTAGHIPQTTPSIEGWNTVGPMARRIADLWLALSVLSETPVTPLEAVSLESRRVLVPRGLWFMPAAPIMMETARRAAGALADAGLDVQQGARVPLPKALLEYIVLLSEGGVRILHEQFRQIEKVSEGVQANLRAVNVFTGLGSALGFGDFDQLTAHREAILSAMGPGGLIIWPVYPRQVPRHGFAKSLYGSPAYTSVFNGLGFPSVSIPVGWDDDDMPLSVQVVARPGEDETALAAAAILEKTFGGGRLVTDVPA
ncbi:MAG: amidase, partial [Chloroflexi bacterium]|nr:amidase [Chloroflexota bacterium]